MEEKKLTDEEIAKAILQQVEYNAGIPYIDEWLKVKTVKFADILNFIYRLQDKADGYERKIENGGLVSIDWHNEQVGHLEEENAELKKQVDEFVKIARVSDTKKLADGIKEQAVKDTAEKFAIAVKENSETEYIYGVKCHKHYSISEDDLNEICKYFTEGVNG